MSHLSFLKLVWTLIISMATKDMMFNLTVSVTAIRTYIRKDIIWSLKNAAETHSLFFNTWLEQACIQPDACIQKVSVQTKVCVWPDWVSLEDIHTMMSSVHADVSVYTHLSSWWVSLIKVYSLWQKRFIALIAFLPPGKLVKAHLFWIC